MKYISFAALLCLLPLFAQAETPAAQPAEKNPAVEIHHSPFTAIYQAVFKNFPLQATHQLERAGNDWYFSSIASGFFGQIEENATFSYTHDNITPLHYIYKRSVLGHNRENELTYNPTEKVAAGKKGSKSFRLKLQGDELDLGTYALALRDDVARGITEPCYKVIEADEVDRYCFRVTGKETIETALGKLDTVVVERIRKAESPRRTRFWFAPSLDYVIARLQHQEQKGETAYSLEITYYKKEN